MGRFTGYDSLLKITIDNCDYFLRATKIKTEIFLSASDLAFMFGVDEATTKKIWVKKKQELSHLICVDKPFKVKRENSKRCLSSFPCSFSQTKIIDVIETLSVYWRRSSNTFQHFADDFGEIYLPEVFKVESCKRLSKNTDEADRYELDQEAKILSRCKNLTYGDLQDSIRAVLPVDDKTAWKIKKTLLAAMGLTEDEVYQSKRSRLAFNVQLKKHQDKLFEGKKQAFTFHLSESQLFELRQIAGDDRVFRLGRLVMPVVQEILSEVDF